MKNDYDTAIAADVGAAIAARQVNTLELGNRARGEK